MKQELKWLDNEKGIKSDFCYFQENGKWVAIPSSDSKVFIEEKENGIIEAIFEFENPGFIAGIRMDSSKCCTNPFNKLECSFPDKEIEREIINSLCELTASFDVDSKAYDFQSFVELVEIVWANLAPEEE